MQILNKKLEDSIKQVKQYDIVDLNKCFYVETEEFKKLNPVEKGYYERSKKSLIAEIQILRDAIKELESTKQTTFNNTINVTGSFVDADTFTEVLKIQFDQLINDLRRV